MVDEGGESTVRIQRYPNRRLYDRSCRRYVTIQDIEDHILAGRTVEIRDSKTGDDLTRQVLTQILAERHPRKMEMFPVAMLHDIIRANEIGLDLWRGYMRQSLMAIEAWRNAAIPFASPLDWMSPILSAFTPLAPGPDSIGRRLQELSDRVRRLEATADQPPARPAGADPLGVLEERLERLEGRDPARKDRKPPRGGGS
jgi:polyhydroxyalkanoate synthesis repressor PhaR